MLHELCEPPGATLTRELLSAAALYAALSLRHPCHSCNHTLHTLATTLGDDSSPTSSSLQSSSASQSAQPCSQTAPSPLHSVQSPSKIPAAAKLLPSPAHIAHGSDVSCLQPPQSYCAVLVRALSAFSSAAGKLHQLKCCMFDLGSAGTLTALSDWLTLEA